MMTEEKRYTIFISSTYLDLQKERQELIYAATQQNAAVKCMEFFPAQDRDKWEAIKEAIDESDIYVLLTGSRYGSIDPHSGISYTEREFEYAKQAGKYLIVLIKSNYKTDSQYNSDPNKDLLDKFITNLERHSILPDYWETADRIGEKFVNAYKKCIGDERMQGKGWIRSSIFSGFLDLVSLSQNDMGQDIRGMQRLKSKIAAIEKAKSLDIAVHTGCFYFTDIGYNGEVFAQISHKLANGSLERLRVLLFHPYTLNGILMAKEGNDDGLKPNLINSILNKLIIAYPEIIDDELKTMLVGVVNGKEDTEYYTKFNLALKKIKKLLIRTAMLSPPLKIASNRFLIALKS